LALKRRQQEQSPESGEIEGKQMRKNSLSVLAEGKPVSGEAGTSDPQKNNDEGKESPSDRSMAKSTRVIAILTGALFSVAVVSAVITYFQWQELHFGSVDTHAMAVAAGDQSRATSDEVGLIRQQLRAWAFVSDIKIFDNIRYQKDGYAHATIELKIRNNGQLPAFNDFTKAALIDASVTDDTPEHQAQLLCFDEPGAPVYKTNSEMTIFPSEETVILIGADLTKGESVLLKKNPVNIWTVIVGCVDYATVPGGDIHHSGFAYNTFIKNDDPRDIMLHASDEPVGKERISLKKSPQAGFAD
jgi:hypothetical protein